MFGPATFILKSLPMALSCSEIDVNRFRSQADYNGDVLDPATEVYGFCSRRNSQIRRMLFTGV